MILDILKKRYSCREFSDQQIPGDVIRYIVECGRLAPSGGNGQPWKFGVITDKNIINELTKASSVCYDQSWISTSSLLIALCTQISDYKGDVLDMSRYPSYHHKIKQMDKELYSLISMKGYAVHIPGEHMVLAAMEHGVYSTWIGALDCEIAARILNVTGYYITSLIAFGYRCWWNSIFIGIHCGIELCGDVSKHRLRAKFEELTKWGKMHAIDRDQ